MRCPCRNIWKTQCLLDLRSLWRVKCLRPAVTRDVGRICRCHLSHSPQLPTVILLHSLHEKGQLQFQYRGHSVKLQSVMMSNGHYRMGPWNRMFGAQSYGWKREPYCPPYQMTPWVRCNDTKVKTVVMTSVAKQTTGDEEVIMKSEGQPP